MAHTKPILAASSGVLGAALVLMAIHIQRDRLAFTADDSRNSDVLSSLTIVAPAPVAVESSAVEELPSVEIEPLEVVPEKRVAPRIRKPAAVRERVAPVAPPCVPEWRELESGRAGTKVRVICEPAPAAGVPLS